MAPMDERKADQAEKAAASPHWEVLWGRCWAQRLVPRKPMFIGEGAPSKVSSAKVRLSELDRE